MSFKPILNQLEITFLQSATILMQESAAVRFALPRLYRLYNSLPDSEHILQGLLWIASGLMIGFALGALSTLIW
ncbi:MAG: hypothetical protein JW862_02760 [Anaerolineales bacterium]|nr:hypothetical protein [Anaerolineales bacterium]